MSVEAQKPTMTQPTSGDLSSMAEALESSGDYRVLRRLVPRAVSVPVSPDQPTKVGLLIDFETTGLDTGAAEIIEIGMVKFAYRADGRISHVIERFGALNEPSEPIPDEITALTHITNEMVAGQRIDSAAVSAFVSDANIVIAHNAGFDRKFAERYWPEFEHKPWACSVNEINWRSHGVEGSRLSYLLVGAGFFHDAHRAVDDCNALLEILDRPLGETGSTGLAVLLDSARRNTVRIWAESAPYDLKDALKKRGYRWNDGSDARPRSWYIDVDEDKVDEEIAFLRAEIYRRNVTPHVQRINALTRYSGRV